MTAVVWTHPAVLNGAERVSNVPDLLTPDEIREHVARCFLPYGIEGIDALTVRPLGPTVPEHLTDTEARPAGVIPARDLEVGMHVVTTPGQYTPAIGVITLLVKRPGEVWAWLETYPNGLAHERRAPDLMLNHGDPVRVARHRA